MAIYNIQGSTLEGFKVYEYVEADNKSHALSQIHSRYGMLRRSYQVIKHEVLKEPYDFGQELEQLYPNLKRDDEEILQMIERIKTNQSNFKELNAVKEHFEPIVKAAINSPTLALSEDDRDNIADRIFNDILIEFSSSFLSHRGRLLSYIKMKVRSRVFLYYLRLKYVNANDKQKRRPRSIVLNGYYEELRRQPDNQDDESARLSVITKIQAVSVEEFDAVSSKIKGDLYERIVELRLHDLIRSKRQREIFYLSYGPERLKQIEIADKLKITQGTVSLNLKRAKENVMKNIRRIILDVE